MRYGIGVGREGFTWAGKEKISAWPSGRTGPADGNDRAPALSAALHGRRRKQSARCARLYIGKTLYRVHGTNQPSTIGTFVSSGCIRLVNDDIQDLYQRVKVGTDRRAAGQSELRRSRHGSPDFGQPDTGRALKVLRHAVWIF